MSSSTCVYVCAPLTFYFLAHSNRHNHHHIASLPPHIRRHTSTLDNYNCFQKLLLLKLAHIQETNDPICRAKFAFHLMLSLPFSLSFSVYRFVWWCESFVRSFVHREMNFKYCTMMWCNWKTYLQQVYYSCTSTLSLSVCADCRQATS